MGDLGGKYRRLKDDFDLDASRRRAARKSMLDRQAEEDEISAVKRKIERSIDSVNARREREREEDFERKIAEWERRKKEAEQDKIGGIDDIIRRKRDEENRKKRELELEKLRRLVALEKRGVAPVTAPQQPAVSPADDQPPPTVTRRKLPAIKPIEFE